MTVPRSGCPIAGEASRTPLRTADSSACCLRALGRDKCRVADGLMCAYAGIPPLQEIYALGVKLIPALNGHMVAADAALAVEKGGGEGPVIVVLDSLEEFDAANSRRGGLRRFPVGTDTILTTKAEKAEYEEQSR